MPTPSALDNNAQLRLDVRQVWQAAHAYSLDPSDKALTYVQESTALLLSYDDKFLAEVPVLGEGRIKVTKNDVKALERWSHEYGIRLRAQYRDMMQGENRARIEALSKPIIPAAKPGGPVVTQGVGGDFAAQVADVVRRQFPELAPSLGLEPEAKNTPTHIRNERKMRAVNERPKPPPRGWRVFKTRVLVQLRGEPNLVRTASEQLNATPVIDGWQSIRATAVALDPAAPRNIEPLLKLLLDKSGGERQLIVAGPPLIERALEYRLLLPPQKVSVRAWALPEVKK